LILMSVSLVKGLREMEAAAPVPSANSSETPRD